jgi:HEAT repeat protein
LNTRKNTEEEKQGVFMRWVKAVALAGCLLAGAGCSGGSTDHWIEQLKSPEPQARLKAIRALQERKDDAARVVPALIGALKDDSTDVRRIAAGTLGTYGEEAKSATHALTQALHDREPSVRKVAAQSLKKIDPAAASKAGVK